MRSSTKYLAQVRSRRDSGNTGMEDSSNDRQIPHRVIPLPNPAVLRSRPTGAHSGGNHHVRIWRMNYQIKILCTNYHPTELQLDLSLPANKFCISP
jgi:hypothetical protein